MNPCPSGFVCDEKDCRCTPQQIHRYRSRLSGPLLDRIDLTVEVAPVTEDDLWNRQSPSLDEADLQLAIHRVQKVARTIADLAEERDIGASHVTQALKYRATSSESPDQ